MKKLISITLSALLMMTFMCSCGNNNEENIGDDGKLQNEENIDDKNNVNDKDNDTKNDAIDGNIIEDAADNIENGMDNAANSVDDALTDDKANNNDNNK